MDKLSYSSGVFFLLYVRVPTLTKCSERMPSKIKNLFEYSDVSVKFLRGLVIGKSRWFCV